MIGGSLLGRGISGSKVNKVVERVKDSPDDKEEEYSEERIGGED
jgi:hypothetical protein